PDAIGRAAECLPDIVVPRPHRDGERTGRGGADRPRILPDDWSPGEWFSDGPLGRLAGGRVVTVAGPDGVSVIGIGEGDGSVTITQRDGELVIETEGDVTVERLGELVGGVLRSLPRLDLS